LGDVVTALAVVDVVALVSTSNVDVVEKEARVTSEWVRRLVGVHATSTHALPTAAHTNRILTFATDANL
jgi:hypothetical protein